MVDSLIELLGGRIVGEAQDLAAPDSGDSSGACDEQEAHGAQTEDAMGERAFEGAGLGQGDARVELKAPDQVVGEDTEVLPGAVGGVVIGRDDIEGAFALEFANHLLVRPSAGGKLPQGLGLELEVGGDGGVLEVPVVGAEEVELEVLG